MPISLFQETSLLSSIGTSTPSLTPASTVYVRGLFTNDLIDRDREFVSPEQFKLKMFQNTATLLRNHEFIVDNLGNKLPAGKVHKTIPVIIGDENPNNPSEWLLKNLDTNEIVAEWPKDKSPDLLRGDKGVYIVAEVTHKEVVKQVINGELGAFSWTGFTEKLQRPNGINELTNVDLIEISLVNIPANPNATFVITDEDDPALDMEVSLKDCDIYGMRFNKDSFDQEGVDKIKKSLSINTSTVSETEKDFSVRIEGKETLEGIKVFSFPMGNFEVLASPRNMNKRRFNLQKLPKTNLAEKLMQDNASETAVDVQDKTESVKLYLLDIDGFMKKNPKAIVSTQKTIQVEGTTLEIDTIQMPEPSIEEVAGEVVTDVAQEVADIVQTEQKAEVVVSPTVQPTEAEKTEDEEVTEESQSSNPEVTDQLNALTGAVAQLASIVQSSVEKSKELEEAQKTILDSVDAAVSKKLQATKKQEQAMEDQSALLQKKLDQLSAFSNAVPDQQHRDDVSKTASKKGLDTGTPDINSLFAAKMFNSIKGAI